MSRAGNSGAIVVKPTSNVYTVLVAAAIVVEVVGLLYVWFQASALHGKALFSM